MSKPIVAVVGRPNVGKSTLFNSLCGQQISIVKDTPGVTRDRIYAEVSWLNHNFTLIDTGGIEPDTGDIILSQMREQAEIAIETADVIIFMTDVKQGLVDSDSKVADMLRRSHKPVILVVNKVDSFEKMMPDVYEFYNLGIGEPFPISAVNKLGFGEVLDEVVSHFPEGSDTDEEDDRPKVAIIGKPNVGKSSIINKLVGKNRVIRADIAILVIDATEGVTEQDAKIAGIAHERGKGIIIAVNKWDDIEKNDKTIYEFTNKIKDTLAFMSYAEIIFVSAKTGQRLNKIYELVDHIVDAQTMRIPTGVLNEILTEAVAMKQPPSDKGKRLKIYYMTQVSVKPPTFVMFVNDVALTHFSYTRYIENRIRESFGFRGTSIRFINRERKEKE